MKAAAVPLAEPGAAFAIKGAFYASQQLFALLEVTGTAPCGNVRFDLFGIPAKGGVEAELLSAACGVRDGLPVRHIVAKVDLGDQSQPIACKICADVDGQHVQHWIQIQADDAGRSLGLARQFWPLAEKDQRYLTGVLAPLGRAWAQQPADRPVGLTGLVRSRGPQSLVDLQVIADQDMSRLHNTLLGVRASVVPDQSVRVTLPAMETSEGSCRQVEHWIRHYGLRAQIELVPARAPEATAFHLRLQPASQASVALRAGFIPPQAGWLKEMEDHLRESPHVALVGLARSRIQKHSLSGEISAEHLIDLLADDAIVALAASNDLLGSVSLPSPVCYSVSGAWAEWLMKVLAQGGSVLSHSALDLLETEPLRRGGEENTAIDVINLSQKRL